MSPAPGSIHVLAALLALAAAACGRTGLDAPVDVTGTAGNVGVAGALGAAGTAGTLGSAGTGGAGGAAVPSCSLPEGEPYSGHGTSCPGIAKLNGHQCWQNCQYSQGLGPVIPIPNGAPACLAPFGPIEGGLIVACVQSCAQCTP
jgi:hypothetical protein